MTEKETRIEKVARELAEAQRATNHNALQDWATILTRFASEIEQAKVKECAKIVCPWKGMHNANGDYERAQENMAEAILKMQPIYQSGILSQTNASLNKQEQPESGKENVK